MKLITVYCNYSIQVNIYIYKWRLNSNKGKIFLCGVSTEFPYRTEKEHLKHKIHLMQLTMHIISMHIVIKAGKCMT